MISNDDEFAWGLLLLGSYAVRPGLTSSTAHKFRWVLVPWVSIHPTGLGWFWAGWRVGRLGGSGDVKDTPCFCLLLSFLGGGVCQANRRSSQSKQRLEEMEGTPLE